MLASRNFGRRLLVKFGVHGLGGGGKLLQISRQTYRHLLVTLNDRGPTLEVLPSQAHANRAAVPQIPPPRTVCQAGNTRTIPLAHVIDGDGVASFRLDQALL